MTWRDAVSAGSTVDVGLVGIPPFSLPGDAGPAAADANVFALEMWRASFGGARDFGLGSALAALLFLMIIPAMLFNLRRFRME